MVCKSLQRIPGTRQDIEAYRDPGPPFPLASLFDHRPRKIMLARASEGVPVGRKYKHPLPFMPFMPFVSLPHESTARRPPGVVHCYYCVISRVSTGKAHEHLLYIRYTMVSHRGPWCTGNRGTSHGNRRCPAGCLFFPRGIPRVPTGYGIPWDIAVSHGQKNPAGCPSILPTGIPTLVLDT